MSAFLIAKVTKIYNGPQLNKYTELALPVMAKFGGKRVGSSRTPAVLEGDWQSLTVVIFEFPDMAALDNFYAAPEYQPLIAMRQESADVTLLKIDGSD